MRKYTRTKLVFILVLLLFPLSLNKQTIRRMVCCLPQDGPSVESKSHPEETVAPLVRPTVSVAQAVDTISLPTIDLLKLEMPEIKEPVLSVEDAASSAERELKEWIARNRPEPEVRRLYIPPVEYHARLKDYIIPLALIAAGSLASQSDSYRDFIQFDRSNRNPSYTAFDDIAQYCVAPSLFLLDALGEEKHHPVDQFFLMALSGGITALPVRGLKNFLHESRPNGGIHSFPSGHTAVAFVGAHMIYKEFKDSNKCLAFSGYGLASLVGAARVYNNRHWVCDVLAGAGFAILATELAYLVYFPVRNLITNEFNKHWGDSFIVTPMVRPEVLGLQVNLNF